MQKIYEWLTCDDLSTFEPLRLTVLGAGGTGKSVIINTIVTLLRKMFDYDNVVHVVAPTGVAAFNVGGQTFFHLTSSRPTKGEYKPNQLQGNKDKRKKLIKRFQYSLALLADERSLINLKDIGTTSQIIAETIYGGGPFRDEHFGKLPVVVLFGDDFQLPPMTEGAFQCLTPPNKTGKMTILGRAIMLECAKSVIELTYNKRIQKKQKDDKSLVDKIRTQKELSESEVARLLNLTLTKFEHRNGKHATKIIEREAVHLFYTNDKKNRRNIRKLAEVCAPDNPVAFIRPHGYSNTTGKADRRHFDKDSSGTSMLCRNAIVALEGRNFCPLWGLHNGACGRVDEIVFEVGANPNNGDHPKYIVVDFPHYCGPPWDKNNKTHVPIPIVSINCNFQCCSRKFVPLTLAWARTIHKFQGMSAGPVDEGKIPNMFSYIICDPDRREVEGTALGLFYTIVSRATTLGDADGNGSAIYFIGEHFTEERIRNIGKLKSSDEDYTRVIARRNWVRHLQQHKLTPLKKEEVTSILSWATKTRIERHTTLHERIRQYVQHATNINPTESPNQNTQINTKQQTTKRRNHNNQNPRNKKTKN